VVIYSTAKLFQIDRFSTLIQQLINSHYQDGNCWQADDHGNMQLLDFPYDIKRSYACMSKGCPVNFRNLDRYLVKTDV
jgi:hypothetical protein